MPLNPGHPTRRLRSPRAHRQRRDGRSLPRRDTKLSWEVAIKVLPEEFSQDKERLDHFERAVRPVAQLIHPNIAPLSVEKATRLFIL